MFDYQIVINKFIRSIAFARVVGGKHTTTAGELGTPTKAKNIRMENVLIKLLSWIPKNYRTFTAFVLIIVILIGYGIYFKILPNLSKKKQEVEKECNLVSISGKLIDQNNREINASGVNIEGMNLNEDNTVQGIFTLKGIRIPADSIVSFQVKLADSTYFTNDFDLGNSFKYPVNNCKVDIGIIRLYVKKSSSIFTKVKKQSSSKYNVNIKGDNKGKIIQGDKIIIENDN